MLSIDMSKIPVLILFFNRKENVLSLVEALSAIKPTRLYLSCDGGRNTKEVADIEGIRADVLQAITWECEIFTNFNEYNLGCKLAVSRAVQWFFGQVTEGIVLEDDCIPTPAFFEYVAHCLEAYRDNKLVATIGGRRELDAVNNGEITFSSKFFCWGWASWSDRITPIDVEFGYQKSLPLAITQGLSFWEVRHVKGIHNLMLDGLVNSWAYSYDLAFRAFGQLHVIPPTNFISNIGIGQGTHDTSVRKDYLDVIDAPFSSDIPVVVSKSRNYMDQYFKKTYGLLKTLLFPYASKIKRAKRSLGI